MLGNFRIEQSILELDFDVRDALSERVQVCGNFRLDLIHFREEADDAHRAFDLPRNLDRGFARLGGLEI